jgi:hypothetical protein
MLTAALQQQFLGEILQAALVAEPEVRQADTLELTQMARDALNYLRGNPDPARDYECKFGLGPLGIPCHVPQGVPPNAYGYDPISIGDTDVRMMTQYARMRTMAGEADPCEVERGVRRRCLGYLRDDGLAWTNPASWTGDPIEGYWINKWTSAKLLVLLAEDFAREGRDEDRRTARRLFEGLRGLAEWDGKRAYYPGGGVPVKDGVFLTQGWCADHSRNYPTIVDPCLIYGLACQDAEALDFATAMAEGFLTDLQPGQDEMRINSETGAFNGHVHLHTHAIGGVAHLGIHLGEPRYLDWVQRAYEFARRHGTDYGWTPEHIPQAQHGAETCCVGDMIGIAVRLAQRHPHYFDHVARTVRNYLRQAQFFLTDEFVALFERLHKDQPRRVVDNALAELRKLEGGFVSAPAPDDWVKRDHALGGQGRVDNGIDMMGCCPPEGMHGIWEAWRWTVEEHPDHVRVNLALHRDHPAAQVTAGAPEQGWMLVEARAPKDFQLRPPAWADRGAIQLTRNDQPVPIEWTGPDAAYVKCAGVQPGDRLHLHWPVPAFVQQQPLLSVPGQEAELTVQWEGDEVEAVAPSGRHLRMYSPRP